MNLRGLDPLVLERRRWSRRDPWRVAPNRRLAPADGRTADKSKRLLLLPRRRPRHRWTCLQRDREEVCRQTPMPRAGWPGVFERAALEPGAPSACRRTPDLKDAQTKEIVQWILSLKDVPAARAANAKPYVYTLQGGKKITLDFPLFVEGSDRKVTKDIFRGYALYNSYCYRCHGTDATESELGPNLRHTPGDRHDAAAVSGGGHGRQRRQGDAELGRVLERRRDDEHLQVCERSKSRTACRWADRRLKPINALLTTLR